MTFIRNRLLELFDLKGVELDRGFAAEHGNHNFKFPFCGIDFRDSALETFEGAVNDRDNFADFVVDGELWFFNTHTLADFVDFFFGDGSRLGAIADEASDTWSVSDDVPSFV